MFWSKKLKEERLKSNIAKYEQYVVNGEMLLEDIKNNYLPLRDKFVKFICDKALNRHRLRDVFWVGYEDGKLHFVVWEVKSVLWDGEVTLKPGETLLEETISLRGLNLSSTIFELISKLKDPTKLIETCIKRDKSWLDSYKRELRALEH